MMSSFPGIAYLPNRVTRKTVRNGFNFKLMVVGESGLGKSTLVNSLFLTDLYSSRIVPPSQERIESTMKIKSSTIEMEENGIKLKLTIVDTPGFADSLDNTKCCLPIVRYIDRQFEDYMRKEAGLNRKNIMDTRVHCCLYFVNPSGHGLRPLDIQCLRLLQERVNVIPVIAKADTLIRKELSSMKQRVLQDLHKHGINIYDHPESEDDEASKHLIKELKSAIPYAVVGSNYIVSVDGKKVRGRQYPWGVVDIENPNHCDFLKVRTMLMTSLHDLIEVTQDYHYENYRSKRLAKADSVSKLILSMEENEHENYEKGLHDSCSLTTQSNGQDKRLDKRDEYLKKLQDQIDRMKEQLNIRQLK